MSHSKPAVKPCQVTPFPDETGPNIQNVKPCPEGTVCVTEKTAIDLGLWIRAAIANHDDVKACPFVKERTK